MKLAVLSAICLVVIGSAFSLSNAFPQDTPPQTDREIQALFTAAALLEEKPFDEKARDARAAAMKWIIDTDKVSVTLCGELFTGMGQRYRYTSEIVAQYTIGMAVFKLSKPTAVRDENAVQVAGLVSALTAYEAMVKEQPNAKSAFLDDLLAKRAKGELTALVKKNNCARLETA
jgi:hypothetical protein